MSSQTAETSSLPASSDELGLLPEPDVGGKRSIWSVHAELLPEQALDETREHTDAIHTVSAALAALRIEAGELPADEMDRYPFPDEAEEAQCICPPDLLERGGFRGSCPAHAPRTA